MLSILTCDPVFPLQAWSETKTQTWTWKFLAVLVVIAKNRNNPKYNWWMHKQNTMWYGIYPYNGMSFSHKKGWNTDTQDGSFKHIYWHINTVKGIINLCFTVDLCFVIDHPLWLIKA